MPLKVTAHSLGPLATNFYVLTDETSGESLVIDPGMDEATALRAVRGLQVRQILLTHAHFDHIGAVAALKEATGALVIVHALEKEWLTDPVRNGSAFWAGELGGPVTAVPPDRLVQEGDELPLGSYRLQVYHTPGHTPGGVCYHIEDILFSGDTLFQGSIGRTDFPGGDHQALIDSIQKKLLVLDGETRVLPGHGPTTTIDQERRYNPFLR